MTAYPDEEQHGRQVHGVAYVLVAGRARFDPRVNSASASASYTFEACSWGITYCGMYDGPAVNWVVRRVGPEPRAERGPVARAQAAFRETLGVALPATNAVNHALNDTESIVLSCMCFEVGGFAFVRAAEAFARVIDDSVLHFAAA